MMDDTPITISAIITVSQPQKNKHNLTKGPLTDNKILLVRGLYWAPLIGFIFSDSGKHFYLFSKIKRFLFR